MNSKDKRNLLADTNVSATVELKFVEESKQINKNIWENIYTLPHTVQCILHGWPGA